MRPVPWTIRVGRNIVNVIIRSDEMSSDSHPNPGDRPFGNCQTISDIPNVVLAWLCYSIAGKVWLYTATSGTAGVVNSERKSWDTNSKFPRSIVYGSLDISYVPPST